MIIIAENCPPIICDKILWYKDKRLKARGNGRDGVKWEVPDVPVIDLKKRVKGAIQFIPNKISKKENKVIKRPVNAKDIERIDELDLDNFSCDFSAIEIPKGKISDERMKVIAKQFLGIMESKDE